MKWIRERVLNGELVVGTFLNLASSFTAEIVGHAGFDWVLVDLEHGVGDELSLAHQFQALASTPAVPLVRLPCNDSTRMKRVLDLGAFGVMVPYVNTAEEAESVAAAMRYPPKGIRGVNKSNRACGFGRLAGEYYPAANDNLLSIVQIETKQAVDNLDAIAAVDGVDVLFVGPLDLSASLGIEQQFDHPTFHEALKAVVEACRKAGKTAGMHALRPDMLGAVADAGFTFIGMGVESIVVSTAMKNLYGNWTKFMEGR